MELQKEKEKEKQDNIKYKKKIIEIPIKLKPKKENVDQYDDDTNDSNKYGTYKTVKEGLDYLCDNGYKDNGAIVLKEGTHDTQDVHTGNSYVFNSKYNEMKVSIIADKTGKTFMTAGEMGEEQNNANTKAPKKKLGADKNSKIQISSKKEEVKKEEPSLNYNYNK